jgi:putrescine aminotransferase
MICSPPLIITRDEIDEFIEKAKLALDKTLADVSQ